MEWEDDACQRGLEAMITGKKICTKGSEEYVNKFQKCWLMLVLTSLKIGWMSREQ